MTTNGRVATTRSSTRPFTSNAPGPAIAASLEQAKAYADLLGTEVAERIEGRRSRFATSGTFEGVPVRVSGSVSVEQDAEVSS